MTWFAGGCHCGTVRFEVDIEPGVTTARPCTCSMCTRTGFIHIIASKSRFKVTSGEDALTSYRFNTGVANHLFCSTCGVKGFYVPRSNPDGWSVNARCLDDAEAAGLLMVEAFDGANWEAQPSLAHLSHEEQHA